MVSEGPVLQFTIPRFRASEAVIRMVGQDKFGHYFSGIHYPEGTGAYHHSFCALGGTGRSKVAPAFHFYYTYTAGCRIIFYTRSFQVDVAKGRDVDTDFSCSFEDSSTCGYCY